MVCIIEYASVVKLQSSGRAHYVYCKYFIVPLGDIVLSVLGEDRVLYVSLDTTLGKEYASRVARGVSWNIKKVRVYGRGKVARYVVPKSFVTSLKLKTGDYLLLLGSEGKLEAIPIRYVIEKIGDFRELTIF